MDDLNLNKKINNRSNNSNISNNIELWNDSFKYLNSSNKISENYYIGNEVDSKIKKNLSCLK